ncbi:MAG TPA: VCBS repeat-containing protein, partial [Anaerolineales bacterium]|nr:VCBS repeat-containing protein [Anaerolineales bacterium]
MFKRLFTACLSGLLCISACGQVAPTASLPPPDISFTHQYQISVGDHPTSVFSQDLDLDGDRDLVATNDGEGVGHTISVLLNAGQGGIFDSTIITVGEEPIAVVAADWDSDGDPDLSVANHESDDISILANNGSGGFSGSALVSLPQN